MNLRVLVLLSMLSCSIDADKGSCAYQISSTDGEVSSPNFPDDYPSRKKCTWLFKITTGHRIKLVFHYFEIEAHREVHREIECAYDYVALYDGDSADSPLLGKFCGSKVPGPIFSTTQTMLMAFRSDHTIQRKGFFATHSTVPCSDGYFDCGNGRCVNNSWTCNGVDNCGNSKDEDCGIQTVTPTYLPLQTTTTLVKSEESDGKIYKNETNIFSALRSLTEKVSSVEENQKHLMKSFEDISLNFTRLFLSKEVRPQEKEKDLSSAERKTCSDCEKFIDILRRMLDSRLK